MIEQKQLSKLSKKALIEWQKWAENEIVEYEEFIYQIKVELKRRYNI